MARITAQRLVEHLHMSGLCRDAQKARQAALDTGASDKQLAIQAPADQTADEIIAECDGDSRAAVVELLAIIRSLIHENQALRLAASLGFARRRPFVFGRAPSPSGCGIRRRFPPSLEGTLIS
jgi:hypothetical protein